jgi:Zn-dependent protease
MVVSSILRETNVSLHDVEAELHTLASPTKSAARNLVIVVGSLLLFVLIGAVNADPLGILLVLTVLLIHELGHLAGMKVFGYRDVQMFFIPLFGAAVSGTETNPSGAKRAVVSLCGPVPGIALGIMCAVLFRATGQRVFADGARTFLILNTFNLLPLVPLDGGHCIEAILFARTPTHRALSSVGAGFALALIAIVARDVVFGIIAFFVLASVRHAYFSGKLAAQIRRELAQQGEPGSDVRDQIPSRYIERMIPLLEQRLPEQMCTAPGIAMAVRNIWNMVWFKPPSALTSAFLLLLYLVSFGTGIVATIGAETSFRTVPGRTQSQSRDRPSNTPLQPTSGAQDSELL